MVTQREPAQAGRGVDGDNGAREYSDSHDELHPGLHADPRAESRAESRAGTRADGRDRSHGNAHVVHGSLVRPTLTLGVERHMAALEFTLCLALILGIGVHLTTVCLVAAIVLLVHPTLVWLTARDPLATQIYVRSRGYADYYAPHASAHAALNVRVPRPRPSLRRAR